MLLRILGFVKGCKLNNTDACTLKVKNALVKSVYQGTELTICSL